MPPPLSEGFARANAAGTGGLQQIGGAVEQRLAQGRRSGAVNLTGLELREVPAQTFAIIDAADPAAAPKGGGGGGFSFDDDGAGDKWWENESTHVPGGVARLNLSRNELAAIPEELQSLEGLRTLECSHNRLAALPHALAQLAALQLLDASHNQIAEFGMSDLGALDALTKADLSNNRLSVLGAALGCLRSLAELDVSSNALRELPPQLCQCAALRTLRVAANQLGSLPSELGRLSALEELECGQNQLATLPDSVGGCAALARLDARQNRLQSIPASIAGCAALKELYLGINQLGAATLPPLGSMPVLGILDLSDNGLRSAACAVGLARLERLDLRNNDLSSLEPELGLVESLKWVGLEGNPLRSLRRELAAGPCSELLKFLRTRLAEEAALAAEPWEHASAFDSHVREAAATGVLELSGLEVTDAALPAGCLSLPELHTLHLARNSLTTLGESLAGTLVVIDVARNGIERLPAALAELPALRQLDVSYNPLQSLEPLPRLRAALQTLDVTAVANRGAPDVTAELAMALPPPACARTLERFSAGFNRLGCVPKGFLSADWPALQAIELANNAISDAAPQWFAPSHMPQLSDLNLENNELRKLAPEFGLLPLKCFMIAGNPQRGVKHAILVRGSEAVLDYLKSRCASPQLDPGPARGPPPQQQQHQHQPQQPQRQPQQMQQRAPLAQVAAQHTSPQRAPPQQEWRPGPPGGGSHDSAAVMRAQAAYARGPKGGAAQFHDDHTMDRTAADRRGGPRAPHGMGRPAQQQAPAPAPAPQPQQRQPQQHFAHAQPEPARAQEDPNSVAAIRRRQMASSIF